MSLHLEDPNAWYVQYTGLSSDATNRCSPRSGSTNMWNSTYVAGGTNIDRGCIARGDAKLSWNVDRVSSEPSLSDNGATVTAPSD